MVISAFIRKACTVTGGGRSGAVAGGGMDDVSGRMVGREGVDGYCGSSYSRWGWSE